MSEPDESHDHECECGQSFAPCWSRSCAGTDKWWGKCCEENLNEAHSGDE
jgi:hypothetical protein